MLRFEKHEYKFGPCVSRLLDSLSQSQRLALEGSELFTASSLGVYNDTRRKQGKEPCLCRDGLPGQACRS